MLDNRNLKTDLLALVLLAGVIFLAAALVSFDPADLPGASIFPQNSRPANACGYWGAFVSRGLIDAIGLGAYYLLLSLAAWDGALLVRRKLGQPWLRGGGWLISLAGVATLAAMAGPRLPQVPMIGPGGYLGALGKALLQTQFASLGAYIIASCMVVGGLLLATDYSLVRLLYWVVGKPTRGLGRGVLQVSTAYAQKVRRRSDLDDVDERKAGARRSASPAPASPPKRRMKRKPRKKAITARRAKRKTPPSVQRLSARGWESAGRNPIGSLRKFSMR